MNWQHLWLCAYIGAFGGTVILSIAGVANAGTYLWTAFCLVMWVIQLVRTR